MTTKETKSPKPNDPHGRCAESVFIIADSAGAVGAFLSKTEAEGIIQTTYPSIPMIMYRFPLNPELPSEKIFILPYRDTNAVAFASNDRKNCEEVQRTLLHVALTYEDEIDFWECTVGSLIPAAKRRLDLMNEASKIYADDALRAKAEQESEENTQKLFSMMHGGPLEELARETERLSFLDCVVPRKVDTPEN